MPLRRVLLQRSILILVVVLCLVSVACCKPPLWTPPFDISPPAAVNHCLIDDEIETLCQTCAKQTKSNIVYPMCCENQEEALTWCRKYLGYGIQENFS